MSNYVSLAISDTMFQDGTFKKQSITARNAQDWLHLTSDIISAVNPSHAATIDVLNRKFGVDLSVPTTAPKVTLVSGDILLVCQANLPRLAEGETHSDETVENAEFRFSIWVAL